MDRQTLFESIILLLVILIVCLVVYGILPAIRSFVKSMRCKHTTTRRCYGDERIYSDRRCVSCGKGFK